MMPVRSFLAGLLAAALLASVHMPARAAGALEDAARSLRAAVNAGDSGSILKARARFQALTASHPEDARTHYWLALADWRVVPRLQNEDKKRAQKHCEAGLEALEAALEREPEFAEALALRAGLQGMSLSFKNPMAGMTLGPKMEETMEQALALAPENPRVHLLDGINTLHKPAFVGGGPEKALPKLEKAIALFEAEAGAPTAWGRDDAHIWAGQAAMRMKEYGVARDHFRNALKVNPGNGWVRTSLLPRAEEALAGADE